MSSLLLVVVVVAVPLLSVVVAVAVPLLLVVAAVVASIALLIVEDGDSNDNGNDRMIYTAIGCSTVTVALGT